MSATDTAKELVRIATTHGLAKDVIDLLDKKASLLAEQVTTLEQENTTLLRENRTLKLENENLKKLIPGTRPKGDGLETKTQEILKYYFDNAREISVAEIARKFQMTLNVAGYHTDVLSEKKLISYCQGVVIVGGGWGEERVNSDDSLKYDISSKGRKYIVENGLTN